MFILLAPTQMHTVEPVPSKWYAAYSNPSMLFLLDTAQPDSQQCCTPPETPLRRVKGTTPHTPALVPCLLFALQLWLNKLQ